MYTYIYIYIYIYLCTAIHTYTVVPASPSSRSAGCAGWRSRPCRRGPRRSSLPGKKSMVYIFVCIHIYMYMYRESSVSKRTSQIQPCGKDIDGIYMMTIIAIRLKLIHTTLMIIIIIIKMMNIYYMSTSYNFRKTTLG